MRFVLRSFFVLALLTFQGCLEKECGACFTPPSPFVFEIVDKTTRENLFSNGTYLPEDIEVVTSNDVPIEYSFNDENGLNLIVISRIGWQTEKVNLSVKISDEDIFSLYVDAERLSEDCCSFTRYNDIKIEISAFELDANTGIYRILQE